MDFQIIISEILAQKPDVFPEFVRKVLQTQPGGYGYGDTLCGTRIPILRKIAKKYSDISLTICEKLLQNELHESRFVALIILIYKFKKFPKEVLDVYLKNTKYVNNWDLVDCSAHHILGKFSIDNGDMNKILKLSNSDNLWENRISIVSTWAFIKANHFMLTFDICEKFINHEHHLIHKACGWMLREISKKDPIVVVEFLNDHKNIPSIMKSYAMEWIRKRA